MIAVADEIDPAPFLDYCCVGELALTGAVRAVRGVLPITLEAKRQGKRAIIVPEANAAEAAVVDTIEVYGVSNLRQAFDLIFGNATLVPEPRREILSSLHCDGESDFADVHGQQHVKCAIEIAVAGGHNLLMM